MLLRKFTGSGGVCFGLLAISCSVQYRRAKIEARQLLDTNFQFSEPHLIIEHELGLPPTILQKEKHWKQLGSMKNKGCILRNS